jgi:membrane-associated phospholipid phosphatase
MPVPDPSARHGTQRGLPASAPAADVLRIWPLAVGAVLVVAGLLLWRDAPLNQALFLAVNRLGPDAPTLWSCLSVAGLGLAAWIYLTAFAEDRPERVARLLWILVVGGIVIQFIKHRLGSPRPLAVLGDSGMTVIGEALRTHSMPSGHSAMAFAMLALVLANTRAPDQHDPRRTRLLAALAVGWTVLALGIALSRLAVGAHWPADALFGGGLGLLFAGLSARAWPVAALTRQLARPAGQRLMAAVLVACAVAMAATPAVFVAVGGGGSKLEHQLSTGYPLAEPLQWALALVALAGALRWWRAAGSKAPR